MTTLQTARPSRKPAKARWVALLVEPRPGRSGIVRITVRKIRNVTSTTRYLIDLLHTDYGRAAFRLQKFGDDPDVYDVLLADDGHHSCDCKGHSRWSRCKHVDALAALFGRGLLPTVEALDRSA